ncbi:MAG: hypothetical protein ISR95_01105 [Candidatus Marinimicrobia bacterium]|nr:hypothetical protein [Candidatus Neomarinimicrobiota bacterium]
MGQKNKANLVFIENKDGLRVVSNSKELAIYWLQRFYFDFGTDKNKIQNHSLRKRFQALEEFLLNRGMMLPGKMSLSEYIAFVLKWSKPLTGKSYQDIAFSFDFKTDVLMAWVKKGASWSYPKEGIVEENGENALIICAGSIGVFAKMFSNYHSGYSGYGTPEGIKKYEDLKRMLECALPPYPEIGKEKFTTIPAFQSDNMDFGNQIDNTDENELNVQVASPFQMKDKPPGFYLDGTFYSHESKGLKTTIITKSQYLFVHTLYKAPNHQMDSRLLLKVLREGTGLKIQKARDVWKSTNPDIISLRETLFSSSPGRWSMKLT